MDTAATESVDFPVMQILPPTVAESREPRRLILPDPRSRDPPARGEEEAPVSNLAGCSVTMIRMEPVDDQFAKYPSTKIIITLIHIFLHTRIGITDKLQRLKNNICRVIHCFRFQKRDLLFQYCLTCM